MIMRLMAAFFSSFSSPFHKRKIDKKNWSTLAHPIRSAEACYQGMVLIGKNCVTHLPDRSVLLHQRWYSQGGWNFESTQACTVQVYGPWYERGGRKPEYYCWKETFDIQSQTNKLCPCLELDTLAPTLVTTKLAWSKNASSNIDQSMPVLTLIKANQF